jgi:molybdopterin-containing oxidoreductase family molybdopterin binding subunit
LKSPHLRGITLEDLKKGPAKLYHGSQPYVEFEDKRFRTPSGRMEFYSENYAEMGEAFPVYKEPPESARGEKAKQYPLIFFSTHTRWRWHSNFQNSAWLREYKPEPELEMNPRDARARNVTHGDIVTVFNDRGKCRVKAKLTEGVRPGMVNLEQGWWAKNFLEGSHQHLTHDTINPAQEMVGLANISYLDALVEVKKA